MRHLDMEDHTASAYLNMDSLGTLKLFEVIPVYINKAITSPPPKKKKIVAKTIKPKIDGHYYRANMHAPYNSVFICLQACTRTIIIMELQFR